MKYTVADIIAVLKKDISCFDYVQHVASYNDSNGERFSARYDDGETHLIIDVTTKTEGFASTPENILFLVMTEVDKDDKPKSVLFATRVEDRKEVDELFEALDYLYYHKNTCFSTQTV